MIKFLRKIPQAKLRGVALLRLDFNTEDDWRVKRAIPTIRFLLKSSSGVVILSHKGRPDGFNKELSLASDAKYLQRLLGEKVNFLQNFNFSGIRQTVSVASPKSVFLLENLRFLKGEETNSRELAQELASLGDFYVNDAFAVSHRENASVAAITMFLPSYAGPEMEREIKFLSGVMKKPKKPLIVVLGGGKAKDKLSVIKNFKNRADYFLLGGAPANTMLFLRGMDIKKSAAERDEKELKGLRVILNYKNIILPVDFVFNNNAILDVGRKTVDNFTDRIKKARTIIWNGPLGLIEKEPYARATLEIARAITRNRKAFSLVGGGETVMFLKKHGLDKKISFISTGGGAMLEFLAGKKLPGIKALKR